MFGGINPGFITIMLCKLLGLQQPHPHPPHMAIIQGTTLTYMRMHAAILHAVSL